MSDSPFKQINQDSSFLMSRYETGRGTGHQGALTWDEYMAEVDHYRESTRKHDWFSTAAWLAAQLVGERKLTHADAHHAILAVAQIVHRFEDERRIAPPEQPPSHDTPDMLELLDGDQP